MADDYDALPDVAALIADAFSWSRNALVIARRIGGRLGVTEDDAPEVIAARLAEALGVGPRTVTYDMSAVDSYSVLTAALDEFAAGQRYRARGEGGNLRRDEWAGKADEMRRQAEAAWEARDGG